MGWHLDLGPSLRILVLGTKHKSVSAQLCGTNWPDSGILLCDSLGVLRQTEASSGKSASCLGKQLGSSPLAGNRRLKVHPPNGQYHYCRAAVCTWTCEAQFQRESLAAGITGVLPNQCSSHSDRYIFTFGLDRLIPDLLFTCPCEYLLVHRDFC